MAGHPSVSRYHIAGQLAIDLVLLARDLVLLVRPRAAENERPQPGNKSMATEVASAMPSKAPLLWLPSRALAFPSGGCARRFQARAALHPDSVDAVAAYSPCRTDPGPQGQLSLRGSRPARARLAETLPPRLP